MDDLKGESFGEMLRNRWLLLLQWLRPEPTDAFMLQAIKMVGKASVVLLLIATSPIIIVVLIFVFFAAL